jgi:TusA-related sulfurtransferase
MSSELAEFNCSYYNKTNFNVSQKIKRAIDSTNISEMYLFDKSKRKMQTKKDIWALNAYLEFIDEYNENLVLEGKNEVKEFPITEEIVIKLTDRCAVNTIKVLLSKLNQIQAEENFEKYDGDVLNSIAKC